MITTPLVIHTGGGLSLYTVCISKVPDGVAKLNFLNIWRHDLDLHPCVHFAGPFGPAKCTQGWGPGHAYKY